MEIFDTHCHLNHLDLYKNIEKIIKDAQDVGVKYFLVVGFNKETSLKAVEIASKYENVYATVGFHPTEIDDVSESDFIQVMNLLKHPKVKALGEIGLDYYWIKDYDKQNKQKEWFVKQIKYANKNNIPVVVHCRDAIMDCYQILKQYDTNHKGVLHCFSSSIEMANKFTKLGYYIGLDGPVTFLNSKQPKEVAKEVDINHLLVETDCPYLTPHPHRGKQNEPKFITLVIEEIAKLRNLSYEDVANTTSSNAKKLFHV